MATKSRDFRFTVIIGVSSNINFTTRSGNHFPGNLTLIGFELK
jgi:hypothetical protein